MKLLIITGKSAIIVTKLPYEKGERNMEINDLLKGMDCSCGRHHSCEIQYVAIEKDAARHLPEIMGARNAVLLVADENTFRAAGQQTLAALMEKTVRDRKSVV